MSPTDAVAECLRGVISPPVAVARMLLAGAGAAGIAAAVDAARPTVPDARWTALAALLAGREAALDALGATLQADHTDMGGVPGIAAFFDAAAARAPEAGVALYSLGDPAILAAATAEIVGWLRGERLLSGDVLDWGCGIGRVAAAVAPDCRSVLGMDVAPGMIAQATSRHAAPNLRFAVTDGRTVPPGPFDLVLLVDSMPYVVMAGLADRVVAGLAAALQPGGALVVLNLSYGGGPDGDAATARGWAAAYGWRLEVSRPFTLWDGWAFVFRHANAAGSTA